MDAAGCRRYDQTTGRRTTGWLAVVLFFIRHAVLDAGTEIMSSGRRTLKHYVGKWNKLFIIIDAAKKIKKKSQKKLFDRRKKIVHVE
ncbi:hypothetical protein XYCOK13_34920 [Xylanibacillus composti]|uniref:Uncharacterized protein n=1 Tax=Xylanibacillus composti TaxID=1572762 RepID=A0A8J4H8K4_9BACL|nr:hypothetical protein XYCOK13_34920 [Xylanibacillus composti]